MPVFKPWNPSLNYIHTYKISCIHHLDFLKNLSTSLRNTYRSSPTPGPFQATGIPVPSPPSLSPPKLTTVNQQLPSHLLRQRSCTTFNTAGHSRSTRTHRFTLNSENIPKTPKPNILTLASLREATDYLLSYASVQYIQIQLPCIQAFYNSQASITSSHHKLIIISIHIHNILSKQSRSVRNRRNRTNQKNPEIVIGSEDKVGD